MAMEQGKTILELLLRQILNSYYYFLLNKPNPILLSDLYKQQDKVFENIIDKNVKACIQYVQNINTDINIVNNNQYIYLDKSKIKKDNPNNIVMDAKLFAT